MEQEAVWSDPLRLTQFSKERATIRQQLEPLLELKRKVEELELLHEWAAQGESPDEERAETERLSRIVEAELEAWSWTRRFSETDRADCYLELTSGSGGVESQDWTAMLLRMYLRWAEIKGLQAEILSIHEGLPEGIKSATLRISGPYAHGWMRTESGVHRLVRCSPFDANHRRHTSFSAVFVYPELEADEAIEIQSSDLRIDCFRASGAGGQHVNRTESAVRVTHLPSGIVVQCQEDRSQHRNKAQCLKQLRAKLHQRAQEEKQKKQQEAHQAKGEASWGAQIRSYVLDDSRVKDLRTGVETRNPQRVLDGELEAFVLAALEATRSATPTQPIDPNRSRPV